MKHLTEAWASKTAESRAGHCYRLAGRHLLDFEKHGGTLVHGTVSLDGGPRLAHAWVDEGSAIGVYEPENDRHFSYAEFEARFAPDPVKSISREAALLQMMQTGHWGPWETPKRFAALTARTFWHVTDRRDFEIDPAYQSQGGGEGLPGFRHAPGLFVTPNPELWWMLWRPVGITFAAEIDCPPDAPLRMGQTDDDRDQWFIQPKRLAECSVKRVVPVREAVKEARRQGWGFALLMPDLDYGHKQVHVIDSREGFGSVKTLCADGYGSGEPLKWTTKQWVLDKAPGVLGDALCKDCLAKLKRQRT